MKKFATAAAVFTISQSLSPVQARNCFSCCDCSSSPKKDTEPAGQEVQTEGKEHTAALMIQKRMRMRQAQKAVADMGQKAGKTGNKIVAAAGTNTPSANAVAQQGAVLAEKEAVLVAAKVEVARLEDAVAAEAHAIAWDLPAASAGNLDELRSQLAAAKAQMLILTEEVDGYMQKLLAKETKSVSQEEAGLMVGASVAEADTKTQLTAEKSRLQQLKVDLNAMTMMVHDG